MKLVLFNVVLKDQQTQSYLNLAEKLRPDLMKIPGFIHNERFQNVNNPDNFLSLSAWEDEDALLRWRNDPSHTRVRALAKQSIIQSYGIKVTDVERSYEWAATQTCEMEPVAVIKKRE